jgi:hypothetical protein
LKSSHLQFPANFITHRKTLWHPHGNLAAEVEPSLSQI